MARFHEHVCGCAWEPHAQRRVQGLLHDGLAYRLRRRAGRADQGDERGAVAVDLEPVVANLAKEFGYERLSISGGEAEKDWWVYSSTWVLLSKNKEFLALLASREAGRENPPLKHQVPLWTDDYASLLPIMTW